MTATPEKHTLSKALLYTIGTSIFAAVLYKSLLRVRVDGGTTHSTFLSVFLKPLHFIFGNTAAIADAADAASAPQTPFEDKYFKEYDEWVAHQSDKNNQSLSIAEQDHRKECLENMYYSTVRETIDDFYGDAIMCYDHATASFAYYARTANIPYKYLETISRKYMIETNAPREIHVDIRDEYNKAKDRNTAAATPSAATPSAATPAAAEETPDVFVKLKSYNTVSNLNLHTTTNDKSHKFATTAATASTATPATATATATTATATPGNKIFREKANRYSYRGKITDFDGRAPATATTPAATATATPATGYADFKKQWKTTKSAL